MTPHALSLSVLRRVQRACPKWSQLSGSLGGSQGAQGEGEDLLTLWSCISQLLEIVFLGYYKLYLRGAGLPGGGVHP